MQKHSAPVVRLRTPGDMVLAVPRMLGFVPDQSLVVACLSGARGAVGLTMRLDLEVVAEDAGTVDEVAARVIAAGATDCFAVIFADPPAGGSLPYRDVAARLLDHPRLRVVDVVLSAAGRWWSYGCDDPSCCPLSGTPVDGDSATATSLDAAFAFAGQALLPDRASVVRSLAPDLGTATRAQRRRVAVMTRRAADMTTGDRRRAVLDLVNLLVDRLDDPRHGVSDAEAARLAALVEDVTARDDVLVQAVDPDRRDHLLAVLRRVVRRVPPPYDAGVCSMLAWFGYAHGDGTLANIALDRALATDPTYSLALLIAESLRRQVPPSQLVEVMEGAAADLQGGYAAG